MFEIIRLMGSSETSIALETRKGSTIANSQAPEPDQTTIMKFERLRERYSDWKLRKPACGLYNCFGLVWANRRTGIYDQSALDLILRDDGYRELRGKELPQYGDIALYYSPGSKSMLHAGVVSRLERLLIDGRESGEPIPWILSKWNDTGEVLHHYQRVPFSAIDYTVAFWTERP